MRKRGKKEKGRYDISPIPEGNINKGGNWFSRNKWKLIIAGLLTAGIARYTIRYTQKNAAKALDMKQKELHIEDVGDTAQDLTATFVYPYAA